MNNLFNLQHLKFFYDSVNYGSVSEAAKMNFVTQSAVSQGIAKLEKLFKNPLLYFHRQKIHLTPEGEVLHKNAAKIFKSVSETFEKIAEVQEEVSGTVRFVTTKSLGHTLIPEMYKKLKSQNSLLKLQFKLGGLNLIRTALKREEAEFAIVVYSDIFDQFDKRVLFSGSMNLYQSEHLPKNSIKEGVLVDRDEGLYVSELKKSGLEVNSFGAGWDFVARCTDLGLGVGFFPDYIVKGERYPHLKQHSKKVLSYPYEVCILTNKNSNLSKAAQIFIDRFLQ